MKLLPTYRMDRGGLGDPAFTRGSATALGDGVETPVAAQALSKRESAQEKIERFIAKNNLGVACFQDVQRVARCTHSHFHVRISGHAPDMGAERDMGMAMKRMRRLHGFRLKAV